MKKEIIQEKIFEKIREILKNNIINFQYPKFDDDEEEDETFWKTWNEFVNPSEEQKEMVNSKNKHYSFPETQTEFNFGDKNKENKFEKTCNVCKHYLLLTNRCSKKGEYKSPKDTCKEWIDGRVHK